MAQMKAEYFAIVRGQARPSTPMAASLIGFELDRRELYDQAAAAVVAAHL